MFFFNIRLIITRELEPNNWVPVLIQNQETKLEIKSYSNVCICHLLENYRDVMQTMTGALNLSTLYLQGIIPWATNWLMGLLNINLTLRAEKKIKFTIIIIKSDKDTKQTKENNVRCTYCMLVHLRDNRRRTHAQSFKS